MGCKSFAIAALGLLAAAQASAQTVSATPQSVMSALQAAGYRAELGKDGTGDPMITSATSGSRFATLFYGCTNHSGCTNIQFAAFYDLPSGTTAEKMDAWNAAHRFARAYLDNHKDPVLAMDVNLDKGGLSQPLFRENLDTWTELLAAFEKHIGWSK